jgi:hypothetical protein
VRRNFALLIGLLFCLLMFTSGCKKVYITQKEVHHRIISEIPPGSTFAEVTDFLKKYGWDASTKLSTFHGSGSYGNVLTEEEKQKIKWTSNGGIQTIEKDMMWSWGLSMEFYFDENEKLVTYNIRDYRY